MKPDPDAQSTISPIARNRCWVRDHAARYPGEWLAVLDGKRVARAATWSTLLNTLGPLTDSSDLLVFQVGTDEDPGRADGEARIFFGAIG